MGGSCGEKLHANHLWELKGLMNGGRKAGVCVCVGGWGGVIRDCGKWFVDNTGQKVPLFKGKMLTV